MKQSTREIVKMLAIGFVVMMALPVGYRIYRATHPASEPPRRTLAQFFEHAQTFSYEENERRSFVIMTTHPRKIAMQKITLQCASEIATKVQSLGWKE